MLWHWIYNASSVPGWKALVPGEASLSLQLNLLKAILYKEVLPYSDIEVIGLS